MTSINRGFEVKTTITRWTEFNEKAKDAFVDRVQF